MKWKNKNKESIKTCLLIFIIMFILTSCGQYQYYTEVTEIYQVKEYEIYDTGIGVLIDKEENNTLYFEDEYIFSCEESSRVIAIYNVTFNTYAENIYNIPSKCYLYLNKKDFAKYLQAKYDLTKEDFNE